MSCATCCSLCHYYIHYTVIFFSACGVTFPDFRAGAYCLSWCQGIWFVILPVSPLLCRAAGFTEAKTRHLPFPQRALCVSPEPQRGDRTHTHTHMCTSTQASLATHSLTPPPQAPCTPPSSPQLLPLMPSEERSCTERELETMHVLSKDLLALTSTWTFSAVLLGLDRE